MGDTGADRWTTKALLDDVWARMARPPLSGFDLAVVRRGVLPAVANRPKASVIGDAIDGGPRDELPGPSRTVEPDPARAVHDHLLRGAGSEVLGLLLRTAGLLVEEIQDRLRDDGVATGTEARRALRGKVARRVAQTYDLTGEPPAGVLRGRLVVEIAGTTAADLALQALRLPDATFVRQWSEAWERAWAARGRAASARLSPSAVATGVADRPPFADDARGRWQDGTDRSVLSRYKLVFRANAHDQGSSAGPSDLHVTQRFRHAGPELVARSVIDRACAPLGLARPGHRMAIRSVAAALVPPRRPGADGELRAWAETTAPELASLLDDGPDEQLVGAVRRLAAARTRTADDVERPRSIDRLDADELASAVVRKLWQFLAQQETEWEVTASRAEIARVVGGAFTKSLSDAPTRPSGFDGAPGERTPEEQVAAEEQTLAVMRALGPDGVLRFVALFRTDRPAWRAWYDQLTDGVAGCLEPGEAAAFFDREIGVDDDE
ncbi:hypothetical protein [Actinomycetospora soli]|uniref:hypothetical protein n=1 Tax=Actinomycetospora soli TaxID=2893887 RepID=UPI001E452DCE|nr:hypothetical protein [Actinomycetospora soli]MCD2187850.1 hypothetical protein [Actinomycetospora soli]